MSNHSGSLPLAATSEADAGESPKVIPQKGVDLEPSVWAYRLGAMILLAHVLFCGIFGYFSVPTILDLVLAVGLSLEKAWARLWVLIRASLGLFLVVTIFLRDLEPVVVAISATMQILLCSSLIVILAGESKPWRYVVAASGLVALVAVYILYGVAL